MTDAIDGNGVTGFVKWFDDEKGYGFVRWTGGEDAFVHHSEIKMPGRRKLDAGQRVVMDVLESPKGPQASNVRPS